MSNKQAELPPFYKTWVEFYRKTKQNGVTQGSVSYFWNSEEIEIQFEEIKSNALEELLSEVIEDKEARNLFERLEGMLQCAGHQEGDVTYERFKKVKRIVLTQCSQYQG